MNQYNPKHNPKARRRYRNRDRAKPSVIRVAYNAPHSRRLAERDPSSKVVSKFDNSVIGAYTPSVKLHHGRPHGVARINRRKPVPQAT